MVKEVKFCPIIKEECKKDNCMMWSKDNCLILHFLFDKIKQIEQHFNFRKKAEKYIIPEEKIPDELMNTSIEEMAEKIYTRYIREFPIKITTRKVGICSTLKRPYLDYNMPEYFLNLSNFRGHKHRELSYKINIAKDIVNKRLCRNWENLYKEKFEREKELVTKLSDEVIDWAQKLNLKELKETDLQVFLIENNLCLLKESATNLFNLANLKLKIE